jgi:hypothetical protein
MGLVAWLLASAGCGWWEPETPTCDEPHLFYANDLSGDVYFGCDPPKGWTETPADDPAYGVAPRPPPKPVVQRPWDPPRPDPQPQEAVASSKDDTGADPMTANGSVVWAGTGQTGDTALPPEEPHLEPRDTGAPAPDDTGAPFEAVGGTGGDAWTGDTGGDPQPRRPRRDDTGAPPADDTGGPPPPPADTGAPPTEAGGAPQGDTGSR